MGKRSEFERKPRDYYATFDPKAYPPLVPHLPSAPFVYHEPCAGNGMLVQKLAEHAPHAMCIVASDIEPDATWVVQQDAMGVKACAGDMFITNIPWRRDLALPLIEHLSSLAPLWTLLDADFMHIGKASASMKRCVKVASVGRLLWEPGTTMRGKDNCCWYLFDAKHTGTTEFYGK